MRPEKPEKEETQRAAKVTGLQQTLLLLLCVQHWRYRSN